MGKLRKHFVAIHRLLITLIVIACLVFAPLVLTGCGNDGPSRQEVEQLAAAGVAIDAVIDLNVSIPDDLLAAGLITEAVHVKVKEVWNQVELDVNSFNRGMERVLTVKNPNYKTLLKELSPVTVDIVSNLRTLRSLVNAPKIQQVLAAIQLSLMVISTYFAVQIGKARARGYSDEQICRWVGLPYDKRRFDLLASGAGV